MDLLDPTARPSPLIRQLRLAGFWLCTSTVTIVYMVLLPALMLPRRYVVAIVNSYLGIILRLLRVVTGLSFEVRGLSARSCGPTLIAAKHQSALETLVLQHALGDPAIILKSELLALPIIGSILRKMGHIGVDRSGDLDAARSLLSAAQAAHHAGRPVVIFPEGSRRQVGAPPDYKAGVGLLYSALKAPCWPVAVNSGRQWPAGTVLPSPGHAVIAFLPPIEPGLRRDMFVRRLEHVIEEGTASLFELPARNLRGGQSGKDV